MKFKKITALALALLLIFLCSCGKDNDKDFVNPNFGGTVNLFAYSDSNLNPLTTLHQTNAEVFSLSYNSLLILNNDLSLSNDICDSYSCNEDGTVWTFKLKKGYVFSDGSLLTANNVVNSINMLRSTPKNMYYPLMTYVKSYEAVNDYTLKITLKIKGSTFLTYMNFPVVKSKEEVLGSGPYVVESVEKDKVILKASHTALTNIEQINVFMYPKNNAKINSYLANETEVISASFYELAQLATSTRSTQTEYVSDYFTFLGFNLESETGSDINIRKAIAYLIDKEEITKTLFVGHARQTNSPFKPSTIYHNSNPNDYKYNEEKAKEFLEKSEKEFEDISFSILVNNETVGKLKTAEYIASKLCDLGMNVTVDSVSYERYVQRINDKNFVAFIGEIKMPNDFDVSFMFSTSGNYFGFEKENFTEALHNFTFAKTQEEKVTCSKDIQTVLLNSLPLISLYYRTNTLLTNSRIKADFNPLHNNIYNGFNSWTVK